MNQSKFNALQAKVIQWGTERNFYGEGGTTPQKQFLKLIEEFGEIAGGIARNKPELIKDAIGDVLVVLIGMARLVQKEDRPYVANLFPVSYFNEPIEEKLQAACFDIHSLTFCFADLSAINVLVNNMMHLEAQFGFKPCECLEHAYNEIKDRKGSMVNGVFVKEADLKLN